jgi:hypothetical protein
MKYPEWKIYFEDELKEVDSVEQFQLYNSAHVEGYNEGYQDGLKAGRLKRNSHLEMIDPKPIEPVDAISNVSYENGVFRKYDGVYNTVSK